MLKPKPKFKPGDRVRTLYWIQGAGLSGIPAESEVVVVDVRIEKHGPKRGDWSMPRYKVVNHSGSGLWVYEESLEALGVTQ